MLGIDRPNLSLKVEQPVSTFAEGNARWYVTEQCRNERKSINKCLLIFTRTNKDLDPVPRQERKWGVTSFLAYWISDAFKYGNQSGTRDEAKY